MIEDHIQQCSVISSVSDLRDICDSAQGTIYSARDSSRILATCKSSDLPCTVFPTSKENCSSIYYINHETKGVRIPVIEHEIRTNLIPISHMRKWVETLLAQSHTACIFKY